MMTNHINTNSHSKSTNLNNAKLNFDYSLLGLTEVESELLDTDDSDDSELDDDMDKSLNAPKGSKKRGKVIKKKLKITFIF